MLYFAFLGVIYTKALAFPLARLSCVILFFVYDPVLNFNKINRLQLSETQSHTPDL